MARNDSDTLNRLTSILVDASDLYEEAAELATPDLARELETLASERRELIGRFRAFGMTLGKDIQEQGSQAGSAHEAFMKLRAVVEDDSRVAVAEVERGEDYLRDELRTALESDQISISTRMFLSDVKDEVEFGHDRMSGLKQALEHEHSIAAP